MEVLQRKRKKKKDNNNNNNKTDNDKGFYSSIFNKYDVISIKAIENPSIVSFDF